MTVADHPPIMIDGERFTPCGECTWCCTPPAAGPIVDQGSGPGWAHTPADSCYARALHAAALAKAGLA